LEAPGLLKVDGPILPLQRSRRASSGKDRSAWGGGHDSKIAEIVSQLVNNRVATEKIGQSWHRFPKSIGPEWFAFR